MEILVENIKCGGCMNTITKALEGIDGVADVQIDKDVEKISLQAEEGLRPLIVEKLYALGYPEVGQNNLLEKAKSYVSCMVGRVKKD